MNVCSIECVKIDIIKVTGSIVPEVDDRIKDQPGFREFSALCARTIAETRTDPSFKNSPVRFSRASEHVLSCRAVYHLLHQWLGEDFVTLLPPEEIYSNFSAFWTYIPYKCGNPCGSVGSYFMRHVAQLDAPSTIGGRKIARFLKRGLGIVPPDTLPGDELHAVRVHTADYKHKIYLLVLRRLSESAVDDAVEMPDGLEDDTITGRYTYIGCAWMKNEYGALENAGFDLGPSFNLMEPQNIWKEVRLYRAFPTMQDLGQPT